MRHRFLTSQFIVCFGFVFILSGWAASAGFAANNNQKTRVACVGNSVTYGAGIENRDENSYPAQLQKLLGENYVVANFGKSGATLLSKGHRPYIQTDEYRLSLQFKPEMVIIHLGLNDTDPRNWPNYKDEFITDYTNLIQSYVKSGTPENELWICRMTPIFNQHPRFKSGTRDWFWLIQEAIEQVSINNRVGLIDLHTPLYSRPDLFKDALHPNAEGAGIIAKTAAEVVTGNFGGLQVAPIFADHMVLQQNTEISVWGKANRKQKVTVSFQSQNKETFADGSGNWMIKLDPLSAGGPFAMQVSGGSDENLMFKDILIGEVWFCSGQSNMEFQLINEFYGKDELKLSEKSKIRLLNYKGIKRTNAEKWDLASLEKINHLQYFEGKWEECNPETAADFSAIGYYFGKAISDSLNVPVGIIEMAVGGAPIEAFFDRKTLEFNAELVDVLYNWKENDFIMPWCRERAVLNLAESKNPLQRHPFEPCYIYESGISQLANFSFRGVIWYQGESNAHNVEHFELAFPEFVRTWRNTFDNQQMPFYFAQLSSLDRPSWPEFRDCQRQLVTQIPNSGMVVTSDWGDSLDVHPVHKREIGERFALLAMAKTYGRELFYAEPEVIFAFQNNEKVEVGFKNTVQLKTSNNEEINELEVAGTDKVFYPANGKIEGNKIVVFNPKEEISQIRYGWKPYSSGNLVNERGFPISTFKIDVQNQKK